jgi:hypothetical protein
MEEYEIQMQEIQGRGKVPVSGKSETDFRV